jgi:hypothetical protein
MPTLNPEPPDYKTIPIDALVRDFALTHGELEQLSEWIRRCGDLLESSPSVLYTGPALAILRRIRAGELIKALPASPGPVPRMPW